MIVFFLRTMASFYLVLPSFHVSSTTTQLLRYDSTLLGFTEFPQSPVTEFSIGNLTKLKVPNST